MITAGRISNEMAGVIAVLGDGDRRVNGVAPLDAVSAGQLTFLSRLPPSGADQVLIDKLIGTTVICTRDVAPLLQGRGMFTLLTAENARLTFMRAVARFFAPSAAPPGVHPTAVVDPTATIDPSASVGPYCIVGPRCSIGAGSNLHGHVTLYQNVRIGKGTSINSGTVIGADGYGYERNEAGELEKFIHIGGVVIEDEVEIGSNTSIDRGTLGDTVIERGARIDNQVHIAHNVRVGQDAAVIAQCMVGGGVQIGARAWLAPAAVIMNKAHIGSDAVVGLGAVVVKTVPAGQTVMGSPAQPDSEFRAVRAAVKELVRGSSQA